MLEFISLETTKAVGVKQAEHNQGRRYKARATTTKGVDISVL